MNLREEKYNKYALVREMMETPGIMKSFDPEVVNPFAAAVKNAGGLFLSGEGSSRIFPAKRAISANLKRSRGFHAITEGSTQAGEYNLNDYAVFLASNSGQTREAIRLAVSLKNNGHNKVFGLTSNHNTKLEETATQTHVLTCGKENAVAATKSVVEQGLFYDALLRKLSGEKMEGLDKAAEQAEEALSLKIDPSITDIIRNASNIYFAGRNNGVAEELALKTNEITRKKSSFLEGTIAVHGIEEIIDKNEVLIWIDPFLHEVGKFNECLVKGAGLKIIAVSTAQTIFPTVVIPDAGQYAEYVQLMAGWNLLVETGISLNINLDKPVRARKVGNEYVPE